MTAVSVSHLDAIGSIPPGLLYPHQADGVTFLISKKRAILADDMGLGKTRQAIVALEVAAAIKRIAAQRRSTLSGRNRRT